MPKALDTIASEVPLWKCQQCGQCASVCPSGRHGGIKVAEVMARASSGCLDLKNDRSIWLCTMCNGCSERCEQGVQPSEVITMLRNLSSDAGNCPSHFREESKRYLQTGLCFPKSGLTKKMRGDLHLDDLVIDQKSIDEVVMIAKRTRLGRLASEK